MDNYLYDKILGAEDDELMPNSDEPDYAALPVSNEAGLEILKSFRAQSDPHWVCNSPEGGESGQNVAL